MLSLSLALLAGITQILTGASSSNQPVPIPTGAHSGSLRKPASPAGLTVFKADRIVDGVVEVWASRLDGTPPWRVTGPWPAGGFLGDVRVAPDGKHVAYLGEQDAAGDYGLFIAPIDGSSYVRVSVPGENPSFWGQVDPWSPDGKWLGFMARPNGPTELFVVRPDGSSRTQLSQVVDPLGDVGGFEWSPDSSRVAFMGDVNVWNQREIYTATPDGTELDRVHPPLSHPNMDMDGWIWSPDGSRIATRGDYTALSEDELFASFSDGSGFTALIKPNQGVPGAVHKVAWTPDGTRLLLVADAQTLFMSELWIVAPDGSGWAKLSGALPAAGDVNEFHIAPDGSRVAYRADQTVNDREELYTVKLDGTDNVAISGPFVSGGEVAVADSFAWSPDSRHVAYFADQQVDNRNEVFVAAPDGSGNVKVSGSFYPTSNSALYPLGQITPWSPDSQRLVYKAFNFGGHPISVRADGTGAAIVHGPLVGGGSASDGVWSRDGSRIVYSATQLTAGVVELFASDPDGGDNQLLSGTMVMGGDVSNWVVQ